MPFQIIRNDIARVRADAIVNTANPDPVFASGVDEAIYRVADFARLLDDRRKIGKIVPGEAAITKAYRPGVKYIIHTVCPPWEGGTRGEWGLLASCYEKALALAKKHQCRSIALPLIGTGTLGFPKEEALDTALLAFRRFLEESESDPVITLVVLDRESFGLAGKIQKEVQSFLDEQSAQALLRQEYLGEESSRRTLRRFPLFFEIESSSVLEEREEAMEEGALLSTPVPAGYPHPKRRKESSLEEAVNNLGESFQERLLRMIDERNLTDPQVYKKANIDRKLFSKIRCNAGYIPKKKTIIALSIAMGLGIDDTKDLLASAGLALTSSSKSDVIIRYCLENGIHDIFRVNALLFQFEEPLLG